MNAAPAIVVTVDKIVVQQRIVAAGANSAGTKYIDLALKALLSDGNAFSRWFSPGKTAVNTTDPGAIALIKAIGLDPAVVLAP